MRFVLFGLALILAVAGIRTAFNNVARQVVLPHSSASLDFHGTPMPPADFSAINNLMAKPLPSGQDGFASNIVTQNQQFNERMEDLRNYARNPAGWHGAPPH
jgi:hypothetical protein